MSVSRKDRDVLRDLGKQVAEIAALPVQQETISLWKALNGLKPVRPMVMIDQIPWHEMEVDEELTLETEEELCREVETTLRRTLYSWRHMGADMVVEPVVDDCVDTVLAVLSVLEVVLYVLDVVDCVESVLDVVLSVLCVLALVDVVL